MASQLEGHVEKISDQGNLICDISVGQLADVPNDENTIVTFGGHETHGLFSTDHDQPNSTMVASLGSSGFLEIEIVGISLSEMLGIKAGEKVSIHW